MNKFFLVFTLFFISLSALEQGESIESSYLKSYNYEQAGNYKDAIKSLSPLYRKYPKGYTLNLRLGWLFYLDKKYNNSIEYYKKASLINTSSLEAKFGLIRVYLVTYAYEKAQNLSSEILKNDHYNYYANLYIIESLLAQKKYEIAIQISQKMLALYPTDTVFLQELFIGYKKTKSPYRDTIKKSILILDPNNVLVKSSTD